MEEDSKAVVQARIISEIMDVFERNECDMFDAYRVCYILYETAKAFVKDALLNMEDDLDELLEALKGMSDALESE